MVRNDELVQVAKKAADAWRNTDAYHQAAQIIDMLVEELEGDTLTQPNEPLATGFDVVDTKTGEYPNLEKIALKEDWAKHLMYCDMEGFAIEEDGTLLLLDECGRQACCPVGRFEIRRPPEGEEEKP